jgi:hypothetical protein
MGLLNDKQVTGSPPKILIIEGDPVNFLAEIMIVNRYAPQTGCY